MTWKGTGRSGIGDQAIIGEYDDWYNLSMNGRQWKSPHTKETRDLSGADYWHQRKALEPKIPEDIPTFVNGRPNIQAFAEPVTQPKTKQKKKVPIASRILPQNATLNRLDQQEEELDKAFESGEVSLDEYAELKYVLDDKRARAHKSLCKALGKPQEDEYIGLYDRWEENDYKPPSGPLNKEIDNRVKVDYALIPENSVFNSISDKNSFKKIYATVLTLLNKLSKLTTVAKQLVHEGLI